MHRSLIRAGAALAVAAAVAGCASPPPPPPPQRHAVLHGPVLMLARFADKDGNVSRSAMEQGLRRDFDAADIDRDGVLESDEVRPVNVVRATEDPSQPRVIDWNGNGVIDFKEFAAAPHALFDQLDRDGDDVLTPDEMEGGGAASESGSSQGQSRGGGSRGHNGGGGGRRGGSLQTGHDPLA